MFGLSVSLSVYLFVSLSTTFWPVIAHSRHNLKDPVYTQQVDQVEKVACRW